MRRAENRLRWPAAAGVALVLGLCGGAPVAGQEAAADTAFAPAALAGQVVSATTGAPIEGVVVNLVGSGFGAVTDSAGNFRIPRAPAGRDTVEVRHIGFRPSTVELELEPRATTHVVFLLSEQAVRVADLRVEVERTGRRGKLAEFERRRRSGFGHFFTPEEIEDRKPLRKTSDLLREVPGIRVGPERFGRSPVTITRSGRNCQPSLYLDGIPMFNMEVDEISAEELGAIEVYRGPSETPPEFMRLGNDCGAIVIWTPQGGPRPGSDR